MERFAALPLPLLSPSPSSAARCAPLPRALVATVSGCDHMLRRWVWLSLRPVIQVFLVCVDKGVGVGGGGGEYIGVVTCGGGAVLAFARQVAVMCRFLKGQIR